MAYLTAAELAALVGSKDLATAAPDPDEADRYDAAAVTEQLEAASDWIDDQLRLRYVVPLDDPPEWLKDAAGYIAHAWLCGDVETSDTIRRRRQRAERSVRQAGSGKVLLDAPRTRQGRVSVTRPTGRTDWRGLV